MPTHEETIRGIYRDMFETGDTSRAAEIATPDCVDHAAPPNSGPAGPEQLAGVVKYLHSALTGIAYTIDDVLADGDRVAYRATLRATQTGELFGFPPTGRAFAMSQIHIVRFDGDRIAEHWACRDDLGVLRQLGHVG
jgi:predicted ester cyclase